MPLGDIAGEAIGGIVRIAARVFLEILVEVLLQGAGYTIIRLVRPKADPSDLVCGVVGLAFWAVVGGAGIFVYRAVAA